MDWWNSFESVSKVQTGLAVTLAVLALVTLTFKIRGDQLRKVTDARRAEDRTVLDREPEQKTAEAPSPAAPIEHPQEEVQPGTTQRHFPKDKNGQFLQILSGGISGPVPLTLGYVDADDGEPREFASEFATVFGGDPASMTVVAPGDARIKGIMIQDSADAQTPSRFALNLMAAFESVGFKCTYGKGSPKLGVVRIVVGTKE